MTEAELLALFDRYHDDVYRLAVSFTRSVPDSEDVTQTVFLKLLEKQPVLEPGREKAWLLQVTANQCRDLLRAVWRRRTDPLETAAGLTFERQEEQELFEAVMALPTAERVTVHLHYYEGYTMEEIGRMLKLSPSAVSMRLHRARKRLKTMLKEDENREAALSEYL